MSFAAVFVETDAGNASRADSRRSIKLKVRSRSSSPSERAVIIHNISTGGLLIEAPADALAVGDFFLVDLPEGGSAESKVVWNSGGFFGCAFRQPVSKAALSSALLRSELTPHSGLPAGKAGDAQPISLPAPGRAALMPELNFAATLALAIGLWLVIGASGYWVIT